jgi:hypothetical protein
LQEAETAEEGDLTTATTTTKEVKVKAGFFRIGDLPETEDSPMAHSIFDTRQPQRGEFDYPGQLVQTDGARKTKLTKLFKRRDNAGGLFDALKRMKLDE